MTAATWTAEVKDGCEFGLKEAIFEELTLSPEQAKEVNALIEESTHRLRKKLLAFLDKYPSTFTPFVKV